jgi:uncharacterized protein (DUF1778 family)
MQLDRHIAQVQEQLQAAAALGDDRAREVAAALATAAVPAVRLAVLAALTEASDEITAALLDYPGSPTVSVRLDGDQLAVDVHVDHSGTEADEPRRDEGEPSARISLRLTEALKADIDAAAEQEGVSVNTWLVRAATAALHPGPFPGFGPWAGFSSGPGGRGRGRGRGGDHHHITGWING